MTTYNREQIEQRAFSWGSSEQRACFLVSREAAERVAARVRRALKAQGHRQADHPEFTYIEPDQQWVGTFTLSVRVPGIIDAIHGPTAAEKRATQQARDALKAAVHPEDLVQTWTLPRTWPGR